jgi:hypothetical protein
VGVEAHKKSSAMQLTNVESNRIYIKKEEETEVGTNKIERSVWDFVRYTDERVGRLGVPYNVSKSQNSKTFKPLLITIHNLVTNN